MEETAKAVKRIEKKQHRRTKLALARTRAKRKSQKKTTDYQTLETRDYRLEAEDQKEWKTGSLPVGALAQLCSVRPLRQRPFGSIFFSVGFLFESGVILSK